MARLEHLPDEILLLICSYLKQTDVLYAFENLNVRLHRTIKHYRRSITLFDDELSPMHYKHMYLWLSHMKGGLDVESLALNKYYLVFSECLNIMEIFPNVRRLILSHFGFSSDFMHRLFRRNILTRILRLPCLCELRTEPPRNEEEMVHLSS